MALHPLVEKWDVGLRGDNPLGFPGYVAPENESVRTGRTEHYALIEGRFDVMGGSMGAAHGERVVRAFQRAADERLPIVVITASGGARLQEGMVALTQMARTSAAALAHAQAGLLQVALMRSPTTGGVYASYGSLGDVRAAAPGALIGFAGPRIVHETLNVDVNTESHSAESAFKAGRIDAIVSEIDQPRWVEGVLGLRNLPPEPANPFPRTLRAVDVDLTAPTDAWDAVQQVRSDKRPSGWQWAAALCDSWVELKGLDPVLRAGIATLAGKRVIMVACDRHIGAGRVTPKAYQLARRALKMADRLHLPFVALVDTPGADPGPDAERNGIASEIAKTFVAQASLRVPSIALCVGEGGSGGALALAACDRLYLLPDAIFSVIAPEGAAVILGRDANRAPEFARLLKITAPDLLELGAIDGVISGDVESVRTQLLAALDHAQVGDRARRHDAVTTRWLR
ncbi:MAG TPA: carboxyl transferase domain-containing protein [Acidimicrobiales bacterium]|nr:carboxyl transferase domain-containing protein [Acidimicrobiales bacterium]